VNGAPTVAAAVSAEVMAGAWSTVIEVEVELAA
jgi:hypothetical protein